MQTHFNSQPAFEVPIVEEGSPAPRRLLYWIKYMPNGTSYAETRVRADLDVKEIMAMCKT